MAKYVILTPVLTVNGVDLSNNCSQVTVHTEKDEVDVTGFGSTAREILAGIGDATISCTFFQDFANGKVHQTLSPLFTAGTPFPISVKPTSSAGSTTNPVVNGTVVLLSYDMLAGAMGDASTMDVDFRNATQAGLTYGTA